MLLIEIAKYLDVQGIVTFDETGLTGDCFIMTLPSSPDECVSLYSTGGEQADSKLSYDLPGVQVIVRGTQDPRPAYNRAYSIYKALHGFHSNYFVMGGFYIVSCLGVQSAPIHLDRDSSGRHEYSLNFQLDVKE